MVFFRTSRAIGRRGLLVGAGGLLAAPAVVRAQGSAGVALVIGNSKYSWEASLPNVKRDVTEMAKRFEAYGLRTELLQDAGRDAMKRAIEKLGQDSRGANVAVLYFAGHGVNDERGITGLVPTDADLSSPSALKDLIPGPIVREATRAASNRLYFYDNCRNNPAEGWKQRAAEDASRGWTARGSGPAGETNNLLLLLSTLPGRIALDGAAGQLSPFAGAVLKNLSGEAVDFQTLTGKVRRDLLIATQGRQVLADWDTYDHAFVLNGGAKISRPGNAPPASSRVLEIPGAYAFAQQNQLPLLPGVIAYRPAGGSRDAAKIGSFTFEGMDKVPSVLIVTAVEEGQAADVVLVSRFRGRGYWSIRRATLSGDTVEFTGWDRGPRFAFNWRDASGGGVTIHPDRGAIQSSRFTRLDG